MHTAFSQDIPEWLPFFLLKNLVLIYLPSLPLCQMVVANFPSYHKALNKWPLLLLIRVGFAYYYTRNIFYQGTTSNKQYIVRVKFDTFLTYVYN